MREAITGRGIRNRAVGGIEPGDVFTTTRTFTEEDTRAFAALTRDYNPVHFENRFAEAAGLRGRICHGLLTAALFTEIGGQLGWLASRVELKFRRPVYFNDTLTCRFIITRRREDGSSHAKLEVLNQKGKDVIEGELDGIVSSPKQRTVLAAMRAEGDPSNLLDLS